MTGGDHSFMAHDLKFKHPFTCIVAGLTGSGKTSFTLRFLQNLATLCTELNFGGGILWFYSEKSAVPSQELAALGKDVQFQESVPENLGNAQGKARLIILDDLLNEVYSKDLCDLFTKGSHHHNVSVLLITQNIFQHGRFCTTISLNAKYTVAVKNVRDNNQFLYLARQVYPENSDSLYRAYIDATEKPHGYLILDFAQVTHDQLRYRTNVFPEEYPPVIYVPMKDETDKYELPHSSSYEKPLFLIVRMIF
jgi:hypothetical protein